MPDDSCRSWGVGGCCCCCAAIAVIDGGGGSGTGPVAAAVGGITVPPVCGCDDARGRPIACAVVMAGGPVAVDGVNVTVGGRASPDGGGGGCGSAVGAFRRLGEWSTEESGVATADARGGWCKALPAPVACPPTGGAAGGGAWALTSGTGMPRDVTRLQKLNGPCCCCVCCLELGSGPATAVLPPITESVVGMTKPAPALMGGSFLPASILLTWGGNADRRSFEDAALLLFG